VPAHLVNEERAPEPLRQWTRDRKLYSLALLSKLRLVSHSLKNRLLIGILLKTEQPPHARVPLKSRRLRTGVFAQQRAKNHIVAAKNLGQLNPHMPDPRSLAAGDQNGRDPNRQNYHHQPGWRSDKDGPQVPPIASVVNRSLRQPDAYAGAAAFQCEARRCVLRWCGAWWMVPDGFGLTLAPLVGWF
jgi:hypothetical protein